MKNPFPGMNPYLERYWRDVHASFIVYAREALQTQLPPGMVARIEERVYVDVPQDGIHRIIYPDVHVSEQREPSRGGAATATAVLEQVATQRFIVELEEEPIAETYIEIVDLSGGKVITIIEVLSVANKLPGEGQEVYLRKQRDAIEAGVNLVEVDLLRTGQWVLSVPVGKIPPERRTPYFVVVFRSGQPKRREIYPIALNQRLPQVAIPLRPEDQDVILDLQEVLNRCYEVGRYDQWIDYSQDPDPPLPPEGAQWLQQLLVEKGKRSQKSAR
ncbi:MAG: DUF4058 family protein [bacterium]|nr:DUF4058 family protein [bacterium]MCS7310709.1 DUF4058 family protein [Armatimonadota bacterium]